MFKWFKRAYEFFETLPDRVFPFATEIEGRIVRGRASYLQAVERAYETYGPHRFGYKLACYRACFHLIGSIIFIVLAALIAQDLFGSDIALYVLLIVASAALFVQEFYSHPRRYGQHSNKGLADWLTWVIPMMVYVFAYTF